MRGFLDSQDQKVNRSFSYMPEDLLVCIADRDESSWIAELFRLLRHNSIESAIKALSYLAQSVWMIDGSAFNHVEYIDFHPECLRERDRKYGRPGSCRSQVCGVENAMK